MNLIANNKDFLNYKHNMAAGTAMIIYFQFRLDYFITGGQVELHVAT